MSDPRYATRQVRVTGRLVLGPRLSWHRWRPLVDAAAGRVLTLDLSGVPEVDAAGLGLLVALAVDLRRRHGRLRLVCANPRVRALVRTAGLGAALGLVSEAAVARATRRRDVIIGNVSQHLPEQAACRG